MRAMEFGPDIPDGPNQPFRWRRDVRNFQASNAEALAACADDRKDSYAWLKLSGLEEAPEHLERGQDLGLGWVSILDPGRLTTDLDIPEDFRFIANLCLRYPQEAHDDHELERAGWETQPRIEPLIR